MSVRDEAMAEAERLWPSYPTIGFSGAADRQAAFVAGAEWARDNLAAQEPTDEEVGRAYAEWVNHSPIPDLGAHRLNCSCGDRGFTPPGYEHHRLRAGLSAARAVRRDEEER